MNKGGYDELTVFPRVTALRKVEARLEEAEDEVSSTSSSASRLAAWRMESDSLDSSSIASIDWINKKRRSNGRIEKEVRLNLGLTGEGREGEGRGRLNLKF